MVAVIKIIILSPYVFWINVKATFEESLKVTLCFIPERFRLVWPMFDKYGLLHNKEYLSSLSIRDFVLNSTIQEMAKYCDVETYHRVKDFPILFVSDEDKCLFNPELVKNINITGCGNMAYYALNLKHKEDRDKCLDYILAMQEYYHNFK